jgi:very-short-patch-repair endonuclease
MIVETDGRWAHRRWGQIRFDHQRDLILRAAGYVVLLYTWDQLERDADAVARDILRALSSAARWAG